MILPSKHLREDRALIGVGADILSVLDEPRPVSALWERVCSKRAACPNRSAVSFDWFILALCFLHAISAVDLTADGCVAATERRP